MCELNASITFVYEGAAAEPHKFVPSIISVGHVRRRWLPRVRTFVLMLVFELKHPDGGPATSSPRYECEFVGVDKPCV